MDSPRAALDEARVEVLGHLDPEEVAAVTWLVEAATEADGVRPLSEHVSLHLRHGGDAAGRNVLLYAPRSRGDGLAAYAHLDVTDTVDGPSAELAVDPAHRGRGVGRAMVGLLLRESPDGRLRLWAHGRTPGATGLARALGFVQVRELWQLRRPLFSRLPDAPLPAGVTLRTFRPGEDDEAWVALNARAFADHPEQGSWTLADLRRRMAEPWFDPSGFFLAEGGGRLVGFHWTKVHGGEAPDPSGGNGHGGNGHGSEHGHDPIGEVYVVGIDPAARGLGLGTALTVAGLRHLRSRGLPTAMLYVDADNAAAIRVYTGLGFQRWDVDVMFQRGPRGAPA